MNNKNCQKTKSCCKEKQCTLANLPIGTTATIVEVIPNSRCKKKFADVGLVRGTELIMEAHAPFGGLIKVKVMEASMALHKEDAQNFIMEEK